MPTNRGIDAVIVDMDGLMFDTGRVSLRAWQQAARDHGYTMSDELRIAMAGRDWPDNRRLLLDTFGETFPVDAVKTTWQHYYLMSLTERGIPLKPGLLELLDSLDHAAIPKAVATSTASELARHKLTQAQLVRRFAAIVGGDQVARGKPAPDLFLAAATRLGVPPACCVVLEDPAVGIQAARAAGMIPLMVPDLQPSPPDIEALTHQVCPSLYEVAEMIRELSWYVLEQGNRGAQPWAVQ